MVPTRILVVEDLSTQTTSAAHLTRAGYAVVVAGTGTQALRALDREGPFAAVLLDLQMPDMDGLALLRDHPHVLGANRVVVATADAALPRAIAAMRLGAFEFLVKPLAGKRLVAVIDSAVERGPPVGPQHAAHAPPPHASPPGAFIGTSPIMREIYRQIHAVAPGRATVFITGESGTGKDVCARAIHDGSGHAAGPFVGVNCGAIAENLLASELFGHVKGAPLGGGTEAGTDQIGAVQAAHKGTLFLNDICDIAMPVQATLLRFLQSGTVQRVGSTRSEEVDVRILCATSRDPRRAITEGRFREDLYDRLAVVPLHLPPLRARGVDIAELAQAFLQRFAGEEHKRFDALGTEHLAALTAYAWPGNVRELQNVIRRAAVLFDGGVLPLRALPAVPPQPGAAPVAPAIPAVVADAPSAPIPDTTMLATALRGLTLDQIERIAVDCAIAAAGGSLPAAARVLGVSPSTLYRKRERWLDTRRTA